MYIILEYYDNIYRTVVVRWWQGASGLDTTRTGVANISCSSAVLGGRLRCQHSASEQVLRGGLLDLVGTRTAVCVY